FDPRVIGLCTPQAGYSQACLCVLVFTIAGADFIGPCLPSAAAKPPSGPGWIHQIKHDGFRLIVRRDGANVRLFTRNGYDWTDRYPLIRQAALCFAGSLFLIDGDAVNCKEDGLPDFNVLR